MNWPRRKKWAATIALGCVTFCVTFASSVFSPGAQVAASEFGDPLEVMVLGTALFVLAIAFGPILWGPFSELYGRKVPLFAGVFILGSFRYPLLFHRICRLFSFVGSSKLLWIRAIVNCRRGAGGLLEPHRSRCGRVDLLRSDLPWPYWRAHLWWILDRNGRVMVGDGRPGSRFSQLAYLA